MSGFKTNWSISADDIISMTDHIITKSIANNEKLFSFDLNNNDYNDFIALLIDDITEYTTFHSMCSFLQYTNPCAITREKSYQADCKLREYINKLNFNREIYRKIKECHSMYNSAFDNEQQQFIKSILKGYERNGVNLNDKNRKKLLQIKQEISRLESTIRDYIVKNVKKLKLTEQEIDGLPSIFKHKLKVVSSNPVTYEIVLNKQYYNICMQYINNTDIRKIIETEYVSVCNRIIFDITRLIILRDKHAKILSYENHSDYVTEINGINNSENIRSFLIDTLDKVDNRYVREISTLLKFKSDDNNSKIDRINSWDIMYYITKWKKEYGVSDNLVRQYFPLNHVIRSMLRIYETLFDFKFVKIGNAIKWHPSVKMYVVRDIKNNEIVGYFYMDLIARDGKYDQTRCFVLQQACIFPYKSGKYQLPGAALVASFNNDHMFNHHEVITIFHEFGHIMHSIIGKSKYICFSGVNVENDFIETPSLILEHICWEKDILRKISCHYKTQKHLPDDIIEKLVKMRDIDTGIQYKKRTMISLYDQLIHSSDNFLEICASVIQQDNENTVNDLSDIFQNTYKHIHDQIFRAQKSNNMNQYQLALCRVNFNEDVVFPATWLNNHFFSNDSNILYYFNLWSKICASDIYNHLHNVHKLNYKQIGETLKEKMLKFGGSKKSIDIMMDILGRVPCVDEFIKIHNLESENECSFFFNTEYFNSKKISVDNSDTYSDAVEQSNLNYSDDGNINSTYSNRFSEINPESSVNENNFNILKNKMSVFNGSNHDNYASEDTETLNRYRKIFIKK